MSAPAHGEIEGNDRVTLMYLAAYALPFVIGSLAWASPAARVWLLDHNVLVATDRAVWVLPGLDAGLDLARLVLLIAIVSLLVVVPAWSRIRRRRS